jgi:flagellar protein FlaJ
MKLLKRTKAKVIKIGKKEPRPFPERYRAFCYRTLGKRLEGKNYEVLGERLRQAGIKQTPELRMAMMYMTVIVVTCVSLAVSIMLFVLVLGSPKWFLLVAALTGIAAAASYSAFTLGLKSRISARQIQVELDLPFTLSELSILASTGLPPVKVIRRIAMRGDSEVMAEEFKKVTFKMDVEGKDLITALGETAKESPSAAFRENLWDLSNMIHQGGDLDQHLRAKADKMLQLKRDIQKEFIEKLAQYSDMYISLVLVSVLFIGIIAFLIDVMASDIGGLDANTLLIILTYLIIPTAVVSVSVMVSTAYSRSER